MRVNQQKSDWILFIFPQGPLAAMTSIGSGEAAKTKTEVRYQLGSYCNNTGEARREW